MLKRGRNATPRPPSSPRCPPLALPSPPHHDGQFYRAGVRGPQHNRSLAYTKRGGVGEGNQGRQPLGGVFVG